MVRVAWASLGFQVPYGWNGGGDVGLLTEVSPGICSFDVPVAGIPDQIRSRSGRLPPGRLGGPSPIGRSSTTGEPFPIELAPAGETSAEESGTKDRQGGPHVRSTFQEGRFGIGTGM